ncbi:hypothetical protein [Huintestinicola butyrica]|uniref:hypothetical protein n=1 Tax=Huintestinicola butyrica TaxID=2981728 RepID=UPI0021D37D84|nr:hypothetical protein [Huintestinicola butyrica]MCU6727314.1 hypothetical protein [Huintestinicola butyrica]
MIKPYFITAYNDKPNIKIIDLSSLTNPPKYDILLKICLSQNTAGTALYYTGGHYLERNEKRRKA